jgi:hypothetical protein
MKSIHRLLSSVVALLLFALVTPAMAQEQHPKATPTSHTQLAHPEGESLERLLRSDLEIRVEITYQTTITETGGPASSAED